MPIVQLQILEGRPKEKIQEVIINITETLVETLDVQQENVRVIVTEIPHTHWGKGGKTISQINSK